MYRVSPRVVQVTNHIFHVCKSFVYIVNNSFLLSVSCHKTARTAYHYKAKDRQKLAWEGGRLILAGLLWKYG